MIDIIEFY